MNTIKKKEDKPNIFIITNAYGSHMGNPPIEMSEIQSDTFIPPPITGINVTFSNDNYELIYYLDFLKDKTLLGELFESCDLSTNNYSEQDCESLRGRVVFINYKVTNETISEITFVNVSNYPFAQKLFPLNRIDIPVAKVIMEYFLIELKLENARVRFVDKQQKALLEFEYKMSMFAEDFAQAAAQEKYERDGGNESRQSFNDYENYDPEEIEREELEAKRTGPYSLSLFRYFFRDKHSYPEEAIEEMKRDILSNNEISISNIDTRIDALRNDFENQKLDFANQQSIEKGRYFEEIELSKRKNLLQATNNIIDLLGDAVKPPADTGLISYPKGYYKPNTDTTFEKFSYQVREILHYIPGINIEQYNF